MEICPKCSCIITEDICFICGYKIENSKENQINNTSVFDIFDFIDGKEDNSYIKNNILNDNNIIENNIVKDIKNTNKEYIQNDYIKENYIKKTYDKGLKQTNTLSDELPIDKIKEKKFITNEINKKIINKKTILFFVILIVLFFINPSFATIFIVFKGVFNGKRQDKK